MEDIYSTLHERLSRLNWLLHRNHIQEHAMHGPLADPTRGQGRVLAMLKMQPDISAKDLSYILGIRQQSLNELLNKLEKGGYIERTQSEADKRVMLVRLTEKGQNVQHKPADFSNIFGCLDEDELETFRNYIDRVIVALQEQIGMDDDEQMQRWTEDVRSRLGDKRYERFMAMHAAPPFERMREFAGMPGMHPRGMHPHGMPHGEDAAPFGVFCKGPGCKGHKHHDEEPEAE